MNGQSKTAAESQPFIANKLKKRKGNDSVSYDSILLAHSFSLLIEANRLSRDE